ncbi:hypothetical protein QUA71_25890 [Microcoleus sp. MON1_C5]
MVFSAQSIVSWRSQYSIPNTSKLPFGRSPINSVLRSHLRVSILIVIRRVRSLDWGDRASKILTA